MNANEIETKIEENLFLDLVFLFLLFLLHISIQMKHYFIEILCAKYIFAMLNYDTNKYENS